MTKIKVSYQEQREFEKILELLHLYILGFKIPKGQKGKYKKAYIELDL